MTTTIPPFQSLLSYYSNRSQYPDTQTIRLQDSIRGNLALGLDFPVALCIAVGRHLWLRNTGLLSLNIHVPSVEVKTTLLEGVEVNEKKEYTCSEIVAASARNGIKGRVDAVGVWALAADVKTGLLKGEDVVGFQQGTLFERIEKRRQGTEQILPLWRGGPISLIAKVIEENAIRLDERFDKRYNLTEASYDDSVSARGMMIALPQEAHDPSMSEHNGRSLWMHIDLLERYRTTYTITLLMKLIPTLQLVANESADQDEDDAIVSMIQDTESKDSGD